MKVNVKTEPETGVLTIEEAKKHLELDITLTDQDENLKGKIKTATSMMDGMTGKRTIVQTVELQFDSWKELEAHEVKQGNINSMSISYLDENKVSQEVIDFEAVGKDSYYGEIIFNDTFSKPEIWGVRSITLTVNVGYAIVDVPEDYKTMVKMLLSKMIHGEDIEDYKEHFRLNHKYWNF
ncbi:MAG: hypothetical protein GY714_32245 [Desulfobacterales bacterium]|nr:hypothetical protein [Desulfobacterales bacterium]